MCTAYKRLSMPIGITHEHNLWVSLGGIPVTITNHLITEAVW